GQEASGWQAQIVAARAAVEHAMIALAELALGGTAVGTGWGAPAESPPRIIAELARRRGVAFVPAANRFAALAAHDALVGLHGALRQTAVALMKLASDVRLLASGPRGGLAEL